MAAPASFGVGDRWVIPGKLFAIELFVLLPHPAVVNRGPDVFAHTGIRLLLSGQTGLQLADLIAGDKLRAVLATLQVC